MGRYTILINFMCRESAVCIFFNILPSIAVNICTNPIVVIRCFNRDSVKGSRPLFSDIDSHSLFPITFKSSSSQLFLGFPSDYGPWGFLSSPTYMFIPYQPRLHQYAINSKSVTLLSQFVVMYYPPAPTKTSCFVLTVLCNCICTSYYRVSCP